MRGDVATVRERMNPGPVGHLCCARELEQREQMIDVGVDAARRDEAEQVDVAATRPCALESADEGRIREDRAVANSEVHPHQILEQDAARADRQVADLGVAHLPRREADRLTGGGQARVRVRRPEAVEHRCRRQLDGVAGAGRSDAPAVEDDERYEREAAIWHRLEKDAGSSDAPPTSAPSMSGCPSSSSAFSGLTEPP